MREPKTAVTKRNDIAKRRPGRPSKLVPEVQLKILTAIKCGTSYKTACLAAGIGERTFHRWKQRGEQEDAPEEYRQRRPKEMTPQEIRELYMLVH